MIGSTLGVEEIPAVAAIPLSRRRIRRRASFFSFRPIFLPYLFAAPIPLGFLRLNGKTPPALHDF